MGMRDKETPKQERGGTKDNRQSGTDYGIRGESGEKFPKNPTASDAGGERKERLKGGIALGQADHDGVTETGVGRPAHHMGQHDGRLGEFNEGRKEGVHYEHQRLRHEQGHKESRKLPKMT